MKTLIQSWTRRSRPGFSFFELIVVIVFVALLAAVAVPLWQSLDTTVQNDQDVYVSSYITGGKCLHDTPYDPNRGAQAAKVRFSDTDVLVIIPQGANSYQPAVLSFAVSTKPFSNPELTPADHQTAALLASACNAFEGGV